MFRNIRTLPAGSAMRVGRRGPEAPRCFSSISSILADAEADSGLSVNGSSLSGKGSAGANNREQITDNTSAK